MSALIFKFYSVLMMLRFGWVPRTLSHNLFIKVNSIAEKYIYNVVRVSVEARNLQSIDHAI